MRGDNWPRWRLRFRISGKPEDTVSLFTKAATPAGAVSRGLAQMASVVKPSAARYVRENLTEIEVRKA